MDPSEEMGCQELVEVITDYLEGAMAEVDRARFEAHLQECPWCVDYVEQMRKTIATLGEVREESIPAEVRSGLLAAFRGWRRG